MQSYWTIMLRAAEEPWSQMLLVVFCSCHGQTAARTLFGSRTQGMQNGVAASVALLPKAWNYVLGLEWRSTALVSIRSTDLLVRVVGSLVYDASTSTGLAGPQLRFLVVQQLQSRINGAFNGVLTASSTMSSMMPSMVPSIL